MSNNIDQEAQGLVSPTVPNAAKPGGTFLTRIWSRSRSFLAHVIMVILVALFMRLYVDGRPFLLSHTLALQQADGTTTYERVLGPVQRDVTTMISLLASTARAAATIWLAGIDLRCIFLFMQRGGMSYEGLTSMFRRSLPGSRHFRQKTNFIIVAVLHAGILGATYASSVLTGSVTWKHSSIYKPGLPIARIPLGQTGDYLVSTFDQRVLDTVVIHASAIYSVFYGEAKNRDSSSMHRMVPDIVRSLPIGSKIHELTVPYFAVDEFEWIKDPNSTLSPTQLAAATAVNATGPRVMNLRKWGLIPDGNWGPTERNFSAPVTVSDSRILVIWTGGEQSSRCTPKDIPPDVQIYKAPLDNRPSCFIFANVTYRAGAGRCRRCQVSGTGVIEDVGDVKDLELVDDSVTTAALAIAPYVSTTLIQSAYALPSPDKFTTLRDRSIEILSRSYQVAWNSLTATVGSNFETSNISIAVDASTANVLMWRVALWGVIHAILVGFGFLFRYIHTRGNHPWIEDPVAAALLVDPTPLMKDTATWAGEEAPPFAGMLKMEKAGEKRLYIVLDMEDAKGEKV